MQSKSQLVKRLSDASGVGPKAVKALLASLTDIVVDDLKTTGSADVNGLVHFDIVLARGRRQFVPGKGSIQVNDRRLVKAKVSATVQAVCK
ncbi:Histone-like DNA-binding protein [uncultured Caudovirales phage]|uniref:Histone-like DNA-binding protein n=1 Tax=uncultured Caudovirales phage TaxID=2100421 RepID=A0A6J5QY44_9CAUD|nr:Histone-like DNA-binding protein [uncultured Caudovirales phage]CAB4193554.1 Histone-like DNA-binding protein [uncultured Caudovirales phage]CAB4217393.1 Histone-like DNA-binding protein [uncultured Caudovirales phage]CAB5231304.1 Histone-like DNA-binding protein [uncultured Caudovirales phage]